VSHGEHDQAITPRTVSANGKGSDRNGYGNKQAEAVKVAIHNGGVHPNCPTTTTTTSTPTTTTTSTLAVGCTWDSYWCPLLVQAGISPGQAQTCVAKNGQWNCDGKDTCVSHGGYNEKITAQLVSAKGTKWLMNGYGIEQTRAVQVALANGGVHPDCPCTWNNYWCKKLSLAGIRAQCSGVKGRWWCDGKDTCISFSSHAKKQVSKGAVSADGRESCINGYSGAQMEAIKTALANGGVHPECSGKPFVRRCWMSCRGTEGRNTYKVTNGRVSHWRKVYGTIGNPFKGSLDQCMQKCQSLEGCAGFSKVMWGKSAGKCIFRGGQLKHCKAKSDRHFYELDKGR